MISRIFGHVEEIFLPEYLNKIGFRDKIADEVIDIIEEQNEMTANIYRNDFVWVSKRIINNKVVYELEGVSDDDE